MNGVCNDNLQGMSVTSIESSLRCEGQTIGVMDWSARDHRLISDEVLAK